MSDELSDATSPSGSAFGTWFVDYKCWVDVHVDYVVVILFKNGKSVVRCREGHKFISCAI